MARATQPFHINMGSPGRHLLCGVTAELAWIVLALSLGLTILAYCMMRVQATRGATDGLRSQVNNSTNAIKARLDLSAELLRGAAAMLVLNRTVQNTTWQQYQRNLANQGWPAEVRQLGYAQRISAAERSALRDAMRADAMPGYQIHPLHDQAEHAPILFIAPDISHRVAERPGFDLLSVPAARHALQTATDSGTITFHTLESEASILSMAGHTEAGRAMLVMPLFPGNAVPPTVAARRQQVIGFVFAFIGINEVLHSTDASPYRAVRLIELPDSTTTIAVQRRLDAGEHTVNVPFDLFGNRWQAEVMLPAVSAAQTSVGNADIIALCGGIISALLFAITRLLAAVSRVNRSHSKRTSREIRQLKQQLSATLSCSDYAIMMIDRRQRIMTFNSTAESIFGVGSEKAIGIGVSRFLPHKLTGAKRHIDDAAGTNGVRQTTYRLPNNPGKLAYRYDGEGFPFEATLFKCEHGGQPATMIFLKDLTAEVRAQSINTASTVGMNEAREGRFAGLLHEAPQEIRQASQLEAQQVSQQKLEQEQPQMARQELQPEFSPDHQMPSPETSPSGVARELQLESQLEPPLESQFEAQPPPQPDIQSPSRRASYASSLKGFTTCGGSSTDAFNATSLFFQYGERRRRDSDALETGQLYRQLQSRLLHFDSARDEQQKRLAQEMHDDFGQLLTAMKMDLILLQKQLSKSDHRLSQQLGNVSDLVDTMVVSLRRIIANLPPEQIEEFGLVKGLELLASAHSSRHKICCRLYVKPHLPTLDPVLVSPIYRIIQEALNNVAKHAHATEVDICIEHSNDRLHVRVTDDGCGIAPATMVSTGGFGLIGMRERVNHLHGEMTIDTATGIGTTIHITIPLEIELTS